MPVPTSYRLPLPPRTASWLSAALCALLALCAGVARAADSRPPHRVGLGLGVSGPQLREAIFASVRYDGLAVHAGLFHEYRDGTHLHASSLQVATGTLSNRLGSLLFFVQSALRYAYSHRVATVLDGRVEVYAGGAVGGGPRLHQFSVEDSDHVYWFTSYDVGPSATLGWAPSPSTLLSLSLDVPLVALVSRPPATRSYNNDKPDAGYLLGKVHESPRLAGPSRYQATRLSLDFRYPLSPWLEQRVGYELAFARDSLPLPVESLSHSLRLHLAAVF